MAKPLADGLYLNLSEWAYHNDTALGASNIVDLGISPQQFWRNSAHNPDREEEETPATTLGHYFHALRSNKLDLYKVKPEGMSFSTKAGKAWKADNVTDDIAVISHDTHVLATKMSDAVDQAGISNSLGEGLTEVSYFWTEGDIRRKIRLDFLGIGMAADYKTFSNSLGKDLETCIAHAVAYSGYHIKAMWYQQGINHMRDMAAKGKLKIRNDGLLPSVFHQDLATGDPIPLWYIFVESCAVPALAVRKFTKYAENGTINDYAKAALFEIEHALQIYGSNMAQFGPDAPWIGAEWFKNFIDEDFAAARWIMIE